MMVPATLADFAFIAPQLRADEVEQFMAMTGAYVYDPDVAARTFSAITGPAWALVAGDGRPYLLGGFQQVRPGVANVWLMGTEAGWATHWRTITKTVKRVLRDMLEGAFHRIELVVLASRIQTMGWYSRLGFEREGVMKGWFANCSDAVAFSMTGVANGRR